MLERDFQARTIRQIKELLPGCIVLKNDAGYLQGFPDFLTLYGPKWAALEFKREEDAHKQPNQLYYVQRTAEMSFGRFVYPENVEEVLYELQQALKP